MRISRFSDLLLKCRLENPTTTIRELAKEIGVTELTVKNWINKNTMPNDCKAVRACAEYCARKRGRFGDNRMTDIEELVLSAGCINLIIESFDRTLNIVSGKAVIAAVPKENTKAAPKENKKEKEAKEKSASGEAADSTSKKDSKGKGGRKHVEGEDKIFPKEGVKLFILAGKPGGPYWLQGKNEKVYSKEEWRQESNDNSLQGYLQWVIEWSIPEIYIREDMLELRAIAIAARNEDKLLNSDKSDPHAGNAIRLPSLGNLPPVLRGISSGFEVLPKIDIDEFNREKKVVSGTFTVSDSDGRKFKMFVFAGKQRGPYWQRGAGGKLYSEDERRQENGKWIVKWTVPEVYISDIPEIYTGEYIPELRAIAIVAQNEDEILKAGTPDLNAGNAIRVSSLGNLPELQGISSGFEVLSKIEIDEFNREKRTISGTFTVSDSDDGKFKLLVFAGKPGGPYWQQGAGRKLYSEYSEDERQQENGKWIIKWTVSEIYIDDILKIYIGEDILELRAIAIAAQNEDEILKVGTPDPGVGNAIRVSNLGNLCELQGISRGYKVPPEINGSGINITINVEIVILQFDRAKRTVSGTLSSSADRKFKLLVFAGKAGRPYWLQGAGGKLYSEDERRQENGKWIVKWTVPEVYIGKGVVELRVIVVADGEEENFLKAGVPDSKAGDAIKIQNFNSLPESLAISSGFDVPPKSWWPPGRKLISIATIVMLGLLFWQFICCQPVIEIYEVKDENHQPIVEEEAPFKVYVTGEVANAEELYTYLVVDDGNHEYIEPGLGFGIDKAFSGYAYLGIIDDPASFNKWYHVFAAVTEKKYKPYQYLERETVKALSNGIDMRRIKPQGKISLPANGSEISRAINVGGHAKYIPANGHIWVVIETGGLLWPKEPEVPLDTDGQFRVIVYEDGSPREGKFVLSLYVVRETGHKKIQAWLTEGKRIDSFPGFLPHILEGIRLDSVNLHLSKDL